MNDTLLMKLEDVGCTFYVRKSRLQVKAVEALHNVNIELHKGETIGIIGHNGAGKSTLLQIMSRILLPSSGALHVHKGVSIALLNLSLGFSAELTGKENAVLGAMYLGYTKKEAENRLADILDFAEIGEWADEPIRTYSTGMRMRLAFAVAMEMSPDIMLIDEVLGVGDAYFQKKSSQALINKMQSGQSTVLVSHGDATMRQLCSRVIWLHEGCVYREGAPAAVLDEYAQWVAQLSTETAGAM